MRMRGRNPFQPVAGKLGELLTLAVLAAVVPLLQGCSGGSSAVNANPSPNGGLQSIAISPSTPLLQLAGSRQLSAIGTYGDGSQLDLTSQVKWSAPIITIAGGGAPVATVAVTSAGMVSGLSLGAGVVTATLGSVVGSFQLIVSTNGYSSNTIAILPVLSGKSFVDAAYIPRSVSPVQGAYVVQEVNMDADQSSAVLPVPVALMASVPMPAGFVPNATAASPTSGLVAVISYTSPDVQIIDASNDPTDVTNNLVIDTFKSPVTKSATFYGPGTQVPATTCMICAAVVNPLNNQLLLSTAQGYYSMDLVAGTFTALPFTSALPAPSFTLNPIATDPYLISPTGVAGEVQFLNLTTGAVTSNSALGLTAPNASAIDLLSDVAVVVDAGAGNQALLNLTSPQSPTSASVPGVSACAPSVNLNMVALGLTINVSPSNIEPIIFLGQPSGGCFGFEIWASDPLDFSVNDQYAFAPMPATPDSNPFLSGSDPNAIASFASVVDKKDYGVLLDANQNWIAKINPLIAQSFTTLGTLPAGFLIPPTDFTAGMTGDAVIYLPTPGSVVTLSQTNVTFGNQAVGVASAPSPITLTNLSANNNLIISQIAITGANSSEFSVINGCDNIVLPLAKCTIDVIFTPSASGSTASATLNLTDNGGVSLAPGCTPTSSGVSQTVCLSGTGASVGSTSIATAPTQ